MLPNFSMDYSHEIPQETLRFLQILGKKPEQTLIRLIHNAKSQGTGAEKAMFSAERLARWSKRQASIYAVINHGGDLDAEITGCVGLFMEHDDLTLEQQEAKAKDNQVHFEFVDPIDYREQE